jgi:hypothetical protein
MVYPGVVVRLHDGAGSGRWGPRWREAAAAFYFNLDRHGWGEDGRSGGGIQTWQARGEEAGPFELSRVLVVYGVVRRRGSRWLSAAGARRGRTGGGGATSHL